MKWHTGTLLFAALLCANTALAADKTPVPREAPARVPFTAFRMKPILNMFHSDKSKTPDAKIKTRAKIVVVPQTAKKMLNVTRIVKPVPKPGFPEPQAVANKVQLIPDATALPEAGIPTATFISGIPVPARKPGAADNMMDVAAAHTENQPNIIERILATPEDDRQPRPPVLNDKNEPEAEAEIDADAAYHPPGPAIIARSVRIRDRSRFGEDERTAGMHSSPMHIASLGNFGGGLSRELRNLHVAPLDQAEGVSPVLLPGHTETVAAPDYQSVDQTGVPNEVVVFFQENGAEMEVGQMDVINNDVVSILQNRPDLKLEIDGFAETAAGGPEATQKMALSRALMVREYLAHQQIEGSRLTIKGKGDDTDVEPRDRVEMYFSR